MQIQTTYSQEFLTTVKYSFFLYNIKQIETNIFQFFFFNYSFI